MNTTCHLLVTLILLLSYRSQCSTEEEDPQYVDCKPFECGGLTIRYPFYVQSKQPSYCGWQRFGVSCNDNNQTIINLSQDDYVIHNISYQDKSINVTNSVFSSSVFHCPSSIHNLSFNDGGGFNFTDSKQKHILLVQNCTRNIATSNKNHTQIKCNEDGVDAEHPYWAVYEEDFNQGEFGECRKQVVEVPYEEDNSSSIQGILRKGIVLNYKITSCNCEDSGGRCGLSKTTFKVFCLCPDGSHRSSCRPRKRWIIILGSVLSGAALLIIIIVIIILYRRRRNNKSRPSTFRSTSDLEDSTMKGVTVFSYKELEAATEKFDPNKELGEGGFGVVYYGKLKDGREVAVKRLYEKNYKRIEQFKNEIRILTNLRHPNLVTLYGCTTRHSRELLLVYEFVSNGTVADHVHGDGQTKSTPLLPWSTRMKIAIETATALSYLHSNDIIHRDVKTNNILLDSNFSVKVGDFGLSRLFPADVTHISTAPQGTPGYVDPEYHQCYHLTDRSDVYSFGVVLVELISSLPAVDVGRHRHEINLSNYAIARIQACSFSELVDASLGFEKDFKVRKMTILVAELAFQCLQPERELRPSMDEVLEALKRIARVDYDALESEEMDMSTTQNMKPPPEASPVSVMDKWVDLSKSTTPATSRSS